MIRPITLICWFLALGAGLYLYRAKHEVELIDKHIEQIARETSDIRTESRHLLDEWIRLGEPEQLRKYSDQYLGLKAIEPNQFVRFSDLQNRLPAPHVDPVEQPADVVAQSATGATTPTGLPLPSGIQAATDQPARSVTDVEEATGDDLPVPPIPPATPAVTLVSEPVSIPLQARPVTPRPAVQSDTGVQRPRVADDGPVTPRPAVQLDTGVQRPRIADDTRVAVEPHPSAPKPTPFAAVDPRPATPGQPSGQLQIGGQVQIGAQLPRTAQPRNQEPPRWASQGLPPLQAQSDAGRRPPPRLVETNFANEPRMEVRPAPVFDQRGQAARPPMQSQAQGQVQSAAPAPMQAQPGSLLGIARGGMPPPVPLPLPAPTPVSATWPAPGR